jgi:hypothetical protein
MFCHLSSISLTQFNSITEKFVPDRFQQCSQINTSRNVWMLLYYFWYATTERVMDNILNRKVDLGLALCTRELVVVSGTLSCPLSNKRATKFKQTSSIAKVISSGFGQERHSFHCLLALWRDY